MNFDQPEPGIEKSADEVGEEIAALLDPEEDNEEDGETQEVEASDPGDDEPETDADPDESDDDAETQPEAGDETRYTVKIDGQEHQVSLSELQAGYQRDSDYRRKTQALAEQARNLSSDVASLGAWRQQLAGLAGMLQQQLRQDADPAELERLRQEDPGEWAARMQEVERQQKQLDHAQAEVSRIDAVHAQQRGAQLEAFATEEHEKLLGKVPEWRDNARAQADTNAILSFLGDQYGVAPEELDGLYDHRWLLLARDAWQLHQARAKAPAAVRRAQSVLRPGSAAQRPNPKGQVDRAAQRLAKTGSVDDAAAFFIQSGIV